MKSLLLALALTSSPPATGGRSPINPLAGLAPDAVASVSLTRIRLTGGPHVEQEGDRVTISSGMWRPVTTLDCTLTGTTGAAFVATLAEATPYVPQVPSFPLDLQIQIQFADGRSMNALTFEQSDTGSVKGYIAIDGWGYRLDDNRFRALWTMVGACDNRAHPPAE